MSSNPGKKTKIEPAKKKKSNLIYTINFQMNKCDYQLFF